jgi:glutamyl-tRNA reductase
LIPPSLGAAVAHVSAVPAGEREAFAELLRDRRPDGSILVETCHRVELYAVVDGDPIGRLGGPVPDGVRRLIGDDVVRHLIALATGLRSTVVGEDQILHQLRTAVEVARARGPIPQELDRLFDLALRTGRRARTFLPPHRPSLADLALSMTSTPIAGRAVLVVGAGEMGRLAVSAALAAGASVEIASRTSEHAAAVAAEMHVGHAPFDPGSRAGDPALIVVALRGCWEIGDTARAALIEGDVTVIDLSAPPVVSDDLAMGLAGRLITIDDIARHGQSAGDDRVIARLGSLVDAAYADYGRWIERRSDREVARTMADLADEARTAELAELWRRIPNLATDERDEIERMARHLADRILREPLERLGRDVDGRHERAARELFGL